MEAETGVMEPQPRDARAATRSMAQSLPVSGGSMALPTPDFSPPRLSDGISSKGHSTLCAKGWPVLTSRNRICGSLAHNRGTAAHTVPHLNPALANFCYAVF